jgi:hypothetical protein
LLCGYAPPRVVDYGTLVEITAAVHLLMGATDISDLSFSGPLIPGAGGEAAGGSGSGSGGGGEYGTLTSSGSGGSDPSSGVGSGGGGGASGSGSGGGGGGGGGGHLPFTGFAAGAAVAIGSGLTAAGAALRRAARRRPRP